MYPMPQDVLRAIHGQTGLREWLWFMVLLVTR